MSADDADRMPEPPLPPEFSGDGTETSPPPVLPEPRTAYFVFSATAGEYFRIWIVNTCLSLVTLGIYSAWAKVRLTKYVRASTTLDGVPFTYDADPLAILRGRIVAVVALGVWTGLGYGAPVAQMLLLLPFAFVVPWLIVASLRFNARVTSYRNVGFSFHGGYGDALGYFVVAPALSVLTLYLLIPWVILRQRSWQADNTAWGDRRLRLQASTAEFYAAYVPLIAATFLALVAFFVVIGLSAAGGDDGELPTLFWPVMILVYVGFIGASLVAHAAITQKTLDGLWIGDRARVRCAMDPPRYAWIMASNAVATIATVGLLHPWCEVRRLRYLAAHTSVSGVESFEDVTGSRGQVGSAAGEEIADAFDIEVGF